MTTSAPKIFFTVRDQVFRISVSSLKPLTTHYFYTERTRVSTTKIKPVGGVLGDPIITDSDGAVIFDYYYDSGISTNATEVDQAQKIANNIAGKKEIVVADLDLTSLSDTFEKSSQSYFRSMITISAYLVPPNEYIENIIKVPAAVRITPAPAVSAIDYGGGYGGGYSGDGGGDGGGG
jgi:hypothetical protein